MDPLKEMFNPTYFKLLGSEISQAFPAFRYRAFLTEMTKDLELLELNARMRKTSVVLNESSPLSLVLKPS